MDHWKTIPGYGGHYQISREGLVRVNPRSPRLNSPAHQRARRRINGGGPVARSLGADGYWRVNLKKEDGVNTSAHIHRLLMLTFRPTKKPDRQVNHKDGDKLNNSLENLEWVTQLENLSHAWENGLRYRPRHVLLSADQVKEIRRRYCKGVRPTMRELGAEFGVTMHAIHKIVKFKNWKII